MSSGKFKSGVNSRYAFDISARNVSPTVGRSSHGGNIEGSWAVSSRHSSTKKHGGNSNDERFTTIGSAVQHTRESMRQEMDARVARVEPK